jgi:hypothetical protein
MADNFDFRARRLVVPALSVIQLVPSWLLVGAWTSFSHHGRSELDVVQKLAAM